MNDSIQLIPLKKTSVQSYVRASRRLQRQVGDKAPSAIELIEFELADRAPRDIAATFLDHLRDLERRRPVDSGPESRAPQSIPRRPVVIRGASWPGRRHPLAVTDPARN